MNLLGEPISAVEAFEVGLVNRVVEDHELFDTALAWARKAAGQAPIALEQIKRVSGARRPGRGAVDRASTASSTRSRPRTATRASSAFIEKRAPEFKGR